MLVIEYFSWFMYMYPDVVIGNFLWILSINVYWSVEG
jgi:hypothetical protein